MLHQLAQDPLRHVRALIVAPARELAEQIYQVYVERGRNTKASSACVCTDVEPLALDECDLGSLQNDVLSGDSYAN